MNKTEHDKWKHKVSDLSDRIEEINKTHNGTRTLHEEVDKIEKDRQEVMECIKMKFDGLFSCNLERDTNSWRTSHGPMKATIYRAYLHHNNGPIVWGVVREDGIIEIAEGGAISSTSFKKPKHGGKRRMSGS